MPSSQSPSRWRAAYLGARLAVLLGIVACLVSIVQGLLETPSQADTPFAALADAQQSEFQALAQLMDGSWQIDDLFSGPLEEFVSNNRPPRSRRSVRTPLLPLPEEVAPLGRRVAADGQVTAEMVGPVDTAALLAQWQQAGWTVDDSAAGTARGCRLLRRNEACVAVWTWEASNDRSHLLIVPLFNRTVP